MHVAEIFFGGLMCDFSAKAQEENAIKMKAVCDDTVTITIIGYDYTNMHSVPQMVTVAVTM